MLKNMTYNQKESLIAQKGQFINAQNNFISSQENRLLDVKNNNKYSGHPHNQTINNASNSTTIVNSKAHKRISSTQKGSNLPVTSLSTFGGKQAIR